MHVIRVFLEIGVLCSRSSPVMRAKMTHTCRRRTFPALRPRWIRQTGNERFQPPWFEHHILIDLANDRITSPRGRRRSPRLPRHDLDQR